MAEQINREQLLQDILQQALQHLQVSISDAVTSAARDLYSDYLPYVVTDTDSNIGYRVDKIVENLIAGKFVPHVGDQNLVMVEDGNGGNFLVFLKDYGGLVEPLCKYMRSEIENVRIQQLEKQVASLKAQLIDSFSYRGARP